MAVSKRELDAVLQAFKDKCRFVREATKESLFQETTAQQEARMKELHKPGNYAKWFDYYFGLGANEAMADSPTAPFHAKGAHWLRNMRRITLFNVLPRGWAKSVHGNIGWPMYLKETDIMKLMALFSPNELAALIQLSDIRVQLEANERIIKDYGLQKSYGDWQAKKFQTKDGSMFMAFGIDQPVVGLRNGKYRLHYCNLDDLEDRRAEDKETTIDARVDKVKNEIEPAFDKDVKRLAITNNYCVEGGFMDKMLAEKEGKRTTRKIWVPALDKDGNSMWRERFSNEYLEEEREDLGEDTFLSEKMHKPVKKGKVFKAEWITWVNARPLDQYDLLLFRWDLSYKKEGDYKAGILTGFKGPEIDVLSVFCRRCDPAEYMEWYGQQQREWRDKGVSVLQYYDAIANQSVTFGEKFEQAYQEGTIIEVPMADVSSNQNKEARIEAGLSSPLQSGHLRFTKGVKNTPDWKSAEKQLLGFKKGGNMNDDFPDDLEACVRLGKGNWRGDAANVRPRGKKRSRGAMNR
jgi:hypothetical protein